MKRKIEPRVGLQAASLFESTTRTSQQPKQEIVQPIPEKKEVVEPRGRPKQLSDGAVKSTVTFYNSQIVWLDRLSADIRSSTMAIIDRGTLIRAILTAVEKSGIDLCAATSEEQVCDIILGKLK
jgi:hypothetical protein